MAERFAARGTRTRTSSARTGNGAAGSLLLHAAVAASLAGWAWLRHGGESWGNAQATSAIQATMVSSIPLPPRQPADANNVLATETPSPAPAKAEPKTVETPRPDAVPVPVQPQRPPKLAEKTTPPPPLHPQQPARPVQNKATMGEAPGLRIAMSSTQTRAGTISVGTQDAAFGARFAWYVQQITQKVASGWYTGMLDAQAPGHRVYITFEVERDGTPANVQIAQRSGDASLDQTALNAVRHIDTFGPLPDAYAGSHIEVTYYFDPPARP